MTRPKIYTELANPDVIAEILALFGSIPNAERHIGMIMIPDRFRNLLMRRPGTFDECHDLEMAWRKWELAYLQPHVRRRNHPLTLQQIVKGKDIWGMSVAELRTLEDFEP